MDIGGTVAGALVSRLRAYGVDTVFGMPGVHNLEFYRHFGDTGIRHISIRHEQSAVFMADGYSRASGKPGVALTISGPGLTNTITAIGQAYSDSVPVLVLSSALITHQLGLEQGKVHEMPDQAGIVGQFCDPCLLAITADQVGPAIDAAFVNFAAKRPRPAHISIPQDVLAGPACLDRMGNSLPSRSVPPTQDIERAAKMLSQADQPVLIIGGGASEAGDAILQIAQKCGAAIVSTIAAKGVIDERHPSCLGSTLQRAETQRYLAQCDLVFLIGTELAEPDLYITADVEAGGDGVAVQPDFLTISGKVIRLDIDPAMTTRHYNVDLPLLGDARQSLELINSQLAPASNAFSNQSDLEQLKQAALATRSSTEAIHAKVLNALRSCLPDNGIVAGDMTQLGYTGCVLFEARSPRTWLFPNGFGTLGYAIPAAIGAKLSMPDRAVAAIVGDGGIMFTLMELVTAAELKLPIVVLLWDNQALAEIRDGMDIRAIEPVGVRPLTPNFEAMAAAFHCHYVRPWEQAGLAEALSIAFGADRPTIIHLEESICADWR